MKAARVLRFGPPSVITNDVPWPEPADRQLLVRVNAAGVGNWDALIREGRIKLQPLPLILGSELSGSAARSCCAFQPDSLVATSPVRPSQ